jgi:excisionase family DNA binding protein
MDASPRKEIALDTLMSPQDLAAYLGVPVSTVYAWRYKQEGPPGARLGKHVRYRRADVDQWIAERSASERPAKASRARRK